MVKKSNGKWRMCIDYIDLNKAFVKDSYPLPSIDGLVDAASDFRFLSLLDAYLGYNQIPMHPLDEEMIAFITENYNYALNAELYQDEDEFVNWCFNIALEYKALEMSEKFNNYQRTNYKDAEGHCKPMMYYCCLVYAISHFIKDFIILDDIDGFISSCTGYVSTDQLTTIANRFNLAIRVRRIPDGRNMIEYLNKANNGWYGNPKTAKYCIEIAQSDEHYVPWIEDMGITEYYLDHMKEVDKYAESHGWSDNKKYHTYKKNKNSFIADEKRKGMNVIRFMNKLVELGMTEPIKRNDKDYISYMSFQDFKYHDKHPRW